MLDKNEVAKFLAGAHQKIEPTIVKIIRLVGEHEEDFREPIKLLEVNTATSPSGVIPLAFTEDPPTVPYPSVVIEVTAEEFEQIVNGGLSLPKGWSLGVVLYPPPD